MEAVQAERITMLPGPPAIYQTILNADVSAYDLSSLRLAVTGAAVVPVELVVQMRDELGIDCVVTGYGLTETTGIVACAGTTTTPRSSPTRRVGRSPASRCGSSTPTATRCRPASPARSSPAATR